MVSQSCSGRFSGYRVNCDCVPSLPARVVADCLADPRQVPYLLIWARESVPCALLANTREGRFGYVQMAQMYASVGDKDQAFACLNKAYKKHSWWLVTMEVEHAFDPPAQRSSFSAARTPRRPPTINLP